MTIDYRIGEEERFDLVSEPTVSARRGGKADSGKRLPPCREVQMGEWRTGLTRWALARVAGAVAGALVLLCLLAVQANALSPLPRSDYGVHSVCGAPAPGHVACLALELVPETAAARARTHPLAMRTAQTIEAGSAAQGAYGLGPQQLRNAYFPGEEPRAPASQPQTIAIVDPYNDLGAEADLRVYDEEFTLPECSAANGCFEQVNQKGEKGNPPFPGSVAETARSRTAVRRRERPCGSERSGVRRGGRSRWMGLGDVARHRDGPRDLPELPHRARAAGKQQDREHGSGRGHRCAPARLRGRRRDRGLELVGRGRTGI